MPVQAPLPGTPLVAGALALERPQVAPGEVHVWSSDVDVIDDGAAALLDATESERAARFRFERDRHRFVAHRAFTRRVLGRYLGVEPTEVVMRPAADGKPELDPDAGIAFNTSRSGGLSLVAVSGGQVGVDVEQLRRIHDALPLARSLFSAREWEDLAELEPTQLDAAFLDLWTRKEAVVKALGRGLSVALDACDVGPAGAADDGPWQARLETAAFSVARLRVRPGWQASVAVSGPRLAVRYLEAAELRP